MEATIETGKDGGYIITIGYDDNAYVRQTLNEVGEILEDAFGEEADFDNVPEGGEAQYTYRSSPFGIIRTEIVPPPTKEDWDAQQAVYAEKAAINKAKRDAAEAVEKAKEQAIADAKELAELELLEKREAWQLANPNKRRSETGMPTEDPGEGWHWIQLPGICPYYWMRIKVGK